MRICYGETGKIIRLDVERWSRAILQDQPQYMRMEIFY